MCPSILHNTIAFQIASEVKIHIFIAFMLQRNVSKERVVLEVSQRVRNINRGERGKAVGRGREF